MKRYELKSLIKEVIDENRVPKKYGKLTVDELIYNLTNGEGSWKVNEQAAGDVSKAKTLHDRIMWQDTITGGGYQDAVLKFSPKKG